MKDVEADLQVRLKADATTDAATRTVCLKADATTSLDHRSVRLQPDLRSTAHGRRITETWSCAAPRR